MASIEDTNLDILDNENNIRVDIRSVRDNPHSVLQEFTDKVAKTSGSTFEAPADKGNPAQILFDEDVPVNPLVNERFRRPLVPDNRFSVDQVNLVRQANASFKNEISKYNTLKDSHPLSGISDNIAKLVELGSKEKDKPSSS